MNSETLQRLNDLRMRVVQADEAQRSGDAELAARLMPSDDEIIQALQAARADRAASTARKVERQLTKAEASKFATMDVNDLFN